MFPMAFMFITSELAKSFKFTNKCLTNLCFYNYPQPSLICGDFLKRLGAIVIKQAAKELAQSIQADKDIFINIDVFIKEKKKKEEEVGKPGEFLASNIIIVDVAIETKREYTRL
jgi:hypothetical protein